jgi:hypothetical protein
MAFNYSPKIVTDGLVLYLDAANTRSYVSGSTTWTDLSRNGVNGTLVNGPTFNSANGGSIVFDGSNDYVNTVTATFLGINSTSTPFTISVWFKTSGVTEYYLFDNYNGSNNISLRVDAGVLEVYMAASISGVINAVRFGSGYNNNVWHNFTITWNGSNLLTAYANSINIGNNITTLSGSFESNAEFRIGNRPSSPGPFFVGNISQVSIYNRILSTSEIRQNYNATKTRFGL